MELKLTGYSTALYSSWFFIEECGVLLDAGDGVSAGLLQKSGKVKHIFITHPDRDHLTGLLQFNQLNAKPGRPCIYYPKDSGSFPALQEFTARFDPHIKGAVWNPIDGNERIELNNELQVISIRNEHVQAPIDCIKSVSYKLNKVKRKLKAEYRTLKGKQVQDLIKDKGRDAVTELIEENLIAYSGDTPVKDYERWNGSNWLIHEATFLENTSDSGINPHGNLHSTLPEVMEMVANIEINGLILNHFSPRYSRDEIDSQILRWVKHYNIKIPIYRILPGRIHRNILNTNPLNA